MPGYPNTGYVTLNPAARQPERARRDEVHHDRNHIKQMLTTVQARVWPYMGNTQRFSDS